MVVTRYIQGIRLPCPVCRKPVTPVTVIHNNESDITDEIAFVCDTCNTHLKTVKV